MTESDRSGFAGVRVNVTRDHVSAGRNPVKTELSLVVGLFHQIEGESRHLRLVSGGLKSHIDSLGGSGVPADEQSAFDCSPGLQLNNQIRLHDSRQCRAAAIMNDQ